MVSAAPVGKQPPVSGSHASPGPHTTGARGTHTPPWQLALPVQRSAGLLHDVPSATIAWTQPVDGSQESALHGLPSSQVGGVPEAQTPPWQVSSPLQASPSRQGAPSGAGMPGAQPLAGSQVLKVHGLPPSEQVTGSP